MTVAGVLAPAGEHLAATLDAAAAEAHGRAAALTAAVAAATDWDGPAARAFRDRAGDTVRRIRRAADELTAAAAAVRRRAAVLQAQQDAQRAREQAVLRETERRVRAAARRALDPFGVLP